MKKSSPLKYDAPMQGGSSTYTPLDTSASTAASDSSYATPARPSTGDCPTFPTLCNPVFVLSFGSLYE